MIHQTPTVEGASYYDFDIYHTTEKIHKSTIIEIEVCILRTKGNVDSFLDQPIRYGVIIGGKHNNFIRTSSFWVDEYIVG